MKNFPFLVFSMLLFFCLKSEAQDLTADSLALVAIYNATDGPNWNNAPDWLNTPVDDWEGVSVEDGRVNELVFNLRGLKNEIPADIFNLTGLVNLNIRDAVAFIVDDRIQNFTNLEVLTLNGGNIEMDDLSAICGLDKLRSLNFTRVKNNGVFPICVTEMPLTKLTMANLKFPEIPIPEELGNLVDADRILLSNSGFVGDIPNSLCDLSALKFLYLSGNALTGSLPDCLPNENFSQILLEDCGLTGTFPFGNIGDELGIIKASGNEFTGDMKDLPKIAGTYAFEFAGSNFNGTFDANAFDKEWILRVDIRDNDVDEMVNWSDFGTRLNSLNISGNKLNFGDLENMDIGDIAFVYSDQQPLLGDNSYTLDVGGLFTFNCPAGGTNTTYQWYKNGIMITDATEAELILSEVKFEDMGTYHCQANNEDFPDLELFTGEQTIDVVSNINELERQVLTVYPNPVSNQLVIAHEGNIENLFLVNTLGQRLPLQFKQLGGNMEVSLGRIPAGNYQLVLQKAKERWMAQIQKL